MDHHVIGIGQGGSRIAMLLSPFADNTSVINTNEIDLQDIPNDIPKYVIRDDRGEAIGVGANPEFGAKLFKMRKDELGNFIEGNFTNEDMNHACVWVCAALGGGTGSSGIIPIANLVSHENPMILNLVVALPSERDGINKVKNSLEVLFDVYTRLCVDKKKANLIILDNDNYATIGAANKALLTSLHYLLAKFPDVETFQDAVGHADERDLITVLKQNSGCLTISEAEVDNVFCKANRYFFNNYFNKFLGLDYEIVPTGIWLRDHTEGKNRTFIQPFLEDHKSAVLFSGEYKRLHTPHQIEAGMKLINGTTIMLQTGLPLPPSLIDKRTKLVNTYREYKERTEGRSKVKTAKKLDVSGIKL